MEGIFHNAQEIYWGAANVEEPEWEWVATFANESLGQQYMDVFEEAAKAMGIKFKMEPV